MSREHRNPRGANWASLNIAALVLALGLVAIIRPSRIDDSPQRALDTGPFASTSNEQLIDRLVNVECQGPGFSPAEDLPNVFMPTADDEQLAQEFGLSADWSVPPELRELIARGPAALPELLAHVDDERLTRFGVLTRDHRAVDGESASGVNRHHWQFLSIHFDNEYDPRSAETGPDTPGVRLTRDSVPNWEFSDRSEYTLRVGDLCYVAIGQIVNRETYLFGADGENGLVVNSPVEIPALARAVRQDWSGLTESAHRESLISDAWSRDWRMETRAGGAIERLCFYYSETAETEVLRLLARETFDASAVYDFIDGRLLTEKDPERRGALLNDFQDRHGDAAAAAVLDYLAVHIHDLVCTLELDARPNHMVFSDPGLRAKCEQELAQFVAVFEHLRGATRELLDVQSVADLDQQRRVIEASYHLRSAAVDRAVHNLSVQVQQLPDNGTVFHKWFEEACARRLARTDHRRDANAFLERTLGDNAPGTGALTP